MYTTIAFVLGYFFCIFFQPFFFGFLQIPLDRSFLFNNNVLVTFTVVYAITLLTSAAYPAFLLSAFKPASVLYSKFVGHGGALNLRKFVTVFQFTISVILIITAIVIQSQLYYLRHADTGVQRDNVVMIPFGPKVGKNYLAYKNDVGSLAQVEAVSIAVNPLYKSYDMMGIKPKDASEMIFLPTLMVDQHFISLLNLKWKTPPEETVLQLDKKDMAVLNETAVEKLNLGPQPLYQKVDNQLEVGGVLKDFNYSSLQNAIEPLCLFIVNDRDTSALWSHQGGYLYARLSRHADIPAVIGQLKTNYEKYDPGKPFEIRFIDEVFEAQYKAEDRLSKILGTFTGLAIWIASLGLFGLATFITVQRTKEIGVRKVLGASVRNITLLLSKDFIKLVIIAIVVAAPIAWWGVHNWLQNFAYRISITWWMFAAAGLFVILLAMLTVSYQAIKAALANPVNSLRTE
jgi:putative ABC transport system permease protein